MASLIRDSNGLRRIAWCAGSERRTLRLGRISAKQAGAIKLRIEQLLTARVTGFMDPEALAWVGGLDDEFHTKLARLGLVPSVQLDLMYPGITALLLSEVYIRYAVMSCFPADISLD